MAEPTSKALPLLLVVHGCITLAAGAVLVAAPGAIPSFIDVELAPGGFVVCYFLAGAEFSIAFLSFYATRCREAESLRLAVLTIIVFHAATSLLELYALKQGIDVRLWSNVALRVIVIALFSYYGALKWGVG